MGRKGRSDARIGGEEKGENQIWPGMGKGGGEGRGRRVWKGHGASGRGSIRINWSLPRRSEGGGGMGEGEEVGKLGVSWGDGGALLSVLT